MSFTKVVPELSTLAFPGNCVPKCMPHGISSKQRVRIEIIIPDSGQMLRANITRAQSPKIEKWQKGQVLKQTQILTR